MKRPIFYDTETTGIHCEKDRIVEIAAYDSFQDKTFSTFINPGRAIPKEASQVHGITDDMVKEAPSFADAGQQFIEFCGDDAVLVAHNNFAFDKKFLENEAARYNLSLPKWSFFDTLLWARRYRNDLPKHTLQFLREVYGIEANCAHRALDDTIILHRIFLAMLDDLSIEQAMHLMKRSKNVMPFGKHKGMPLSRVPKRYLSWLKSSGALDKPENADLKEAILAESRT